MHGGQLEEPHAERGSASCRLSLRQWVHTRSPQPDPNALRGMAVDRSIPDGTTMAGWTAGAAPHQLCRGTAGTLHPHRSLPQGEDHASGQAEDEHAGKCKSPIPQHLLPDVGRDDRFVAFGREQANVVIRERHVDEQVAQLGLIGRAAKVLINGEVAEEDDEPRLATPLHKLRLSGRLHVGADGEIAEQQRSFVPGEPDSQG